MCNFFQKSESLKYQ